ncbi:hypothetical protein V1478_005811 [Vespula squamosa]|uniref:Uncharacterized protein n=1 Tax=Vespula squamosa TaxID=30214 RepID=A0ABD2B9V5_VESSQ
MILFSQFTLKKSYSLPRGKAERTIDKETLALYLHYRRKLYFNYCILGHYIDIVFESIQLLNKKK